MSWRGTDFRSPLCEIWAPGFRFSTAWRPGFVYVLAAVSVTVPAGSHYESGKLVPVTVRMVPVTPRTLGSKLQLSAATRSGQPKLWLKLLHPRCSWSSGAGRSSSLQAPAWNFQERVELLLVDVFSVSSFKVGVTLA